MNKQSNNKNLKSSKIQLEENEKLAELISIILGDGDIYIRQKNNSYTLAISLNGIDEKLYVDYVKNLVCLVFHKNPYEHQRVNDKSILLTLLNKVIINSLIMKGLVPGDKVNNQEHPNVD
ncbi:MAG: hypothetical protein ACFFC3_15515 [Candidatus Odinarchaeota archaeon]